MFAICSTILSAAVGQGKTGPIPHLAFEKYTLPNGLQVVLHEDHATPIVGVNIWYHVGSKNERPGRTGFAHLFEHMMFEGSEHYDKVYFGPLQQAGGRLNGSTASDRTNYFETVPSNFLELVLWLESDRMGFLLPAMSQEKLDNQRAVVKNERRQSYENRPYGLVEETILAAMYPPEHPYSWPPIGSMKDIDAASRADIADFFRHYYHPGNASLCIAGDFQPREAKRLVAKYFAPLPAGPKVQRPMPAMPTLSAEKRIHVTDHVGLARIYFAWPTVADFTPDDADLSILAHVLAGGKTSRLYRALVRQQQIAQDVQAYQDSMEVGGKFQLTITARAGHTLAELEAAAAAEIARIRSEPPTTEEMARAVNAFEAQFVRSMESVGGFGGRGDQLNRYNVLRGDPGYMARDFARLAAVAPRGVTAAAQKYLGPGRVVVEVVPGRELSIEPDPRLPAARAREEMARHITEKPLPGGETGTGPTSGPVKDAFDRRQMPALGPEPAFHLPPIRRGRLSNGMELLVVENHGLPLLGLHALCPFGRAADPAGTPGMASLMAAMWDEGTERRSAEQIADELGGIGATLSIEAGADTTSARLFTLKRHLDKALDVFADVLRNPAFPAAELERQRAGALGRLTQVRNEPLQLAGIALREILYGPDHPYGQPQYGTAAALKSISRADLERFYRGQVRPEHFSLIAVGDTTLQEMTDVLERALGDWKSAAAPAAVRQFPPVPPPKPICMAVIDKPGAAQSVIALSLVGAVRKSPDYFPLTVMNIALGGQFSSRLNMNLRQDKGYTYGAHSSFDWRVREPGPFVALASVQTAVTAPALTEFLKEFREIVGSRPVEGEELALSQKYVARGYAGGFETASQFAAQLETLVAFRLPNDYFNTVVPNINAVTAGDVRRVAEKYLALNNLNIVIVGDWRAIQDEVRKLPVARRLGVFRFDENFRLLPEK
jgi:zinc protease